MAEVFERRARQARQGQGLIPVASRVAGDRFARINRAWDGWPVAVFGGGPSLTREQCDQCLNIPRIAVNDAYLLAPSADVLYFADRQWIEWHHNREPFQEFKGQRIKIDQIGVKDDLWAKDDRYYVLRNYGQGPALSERSDGLSTGTASGYQAINLAYLAGGNPILLFGFDAKESAGKMHWFGDHPIKTSKAWLVGLPYQYQRIGDALKVKGVRVINCSPDSALTCFEKGDAESILHDQERSTLPA